MGTTKRQRPWIEAFAADLPSPATVAEWAWAHSTGRAMSNSAQSQQTIAERARTFAPIVWLLGKVQSGKTSIICELTQASLGEIGCGYRACTKSARVFDFPQEAPIIRFLDTRG